MTNYKTSEDSMMDSRTLGIDYSNFYMLNDLYDDVETLSKEVRKIKRSRRNEKIFIGLLIFLGIRKLLKNKKDELAPPKEDEEIKSE